MLDSIDRSILSALRNDARMTHRALGQEVGLSPNAAAARVDRLVGRGVITGFRAEVDPSALGRGLHAFIDCRLGNQTDEARAHAVIAADERIVSAAHVTGRFDYLVEAAAASPADLDDLLRALRDAGVAETETRLVLNQLDSMGAT